MRASQPGPRASQPDPRARTEAQPARTEAQPTGPALRQGCRDSFWAELAGYLSGMASRPGGGTNAWRNEQDFDPYLSLCPKMWASGDHLQPKMYEKG